MKQNDYSVLNQKYSISQLRAIPEYLALINMDAYFKDKLQDNLKYVLNSVDINKAEGFILDDIGWLLGTSREYFDISDYFCLNSLDVNVEKYIYFRNQQTNATGSLSDANFRARIKAKSYANHSRCTREENIQIIKNMTFADKVIIENVSPLLLDITLYGDNLFITDTLRTDIESVLGCGVGIRNLEIENGTE